MRVLVENLRTALKERIDALPWMSAETKKAAQKKLAAFHVKIGYPDTWRTTRLSSSRATYRSPRTSAARASSRRSGTSRSSASRSTARSGA